MTSYIDLRRMENLRTSKLRAENQRLRERLEALEPNPDIVNDPEPLEYEDRIAVESAEKIHGEKYIRARDYVTLAHKRFQVEDALNMVIEDCAFTKDGGERAELALRIFKSDIILDPKVREAIESLLDMAERS